MRLYVLVQPLNGLKLVKQSAEYVGQKTNVCG
nr:MAG TPA: hypothetical protein [Caudoviricetes sp.]